MNRTKIPTCYVCEGCGCPSCMGTGRRVRYLVENITFEEMPELFGVVPETVHLLPVVDQRRLKTRVLEVLAEYDERSGAKKS